MDGWGLDKLQPWLSYASALPVGPLFCVIDGRTRGRQWSTAAARAELAAPPRRGCAPTVRPASAAPRPRRRDRSRRRAARRHSAPARPQQPRHHLGLPPRHRQRRDHRDRPRPPRADDPGQRLASALIDPGAANRAKGERRSTPDLATGYGVRAACSITGHFELFSGPAGAPVASDQPRQRLHRLPPCPRRRQLADRPRRSASGAGRAARRARALPAPGDQAARYEAMAVHWHARFFARPVASVSPIPSSCSLPCMR